MVKQQTQRVVFQPAAYDGMRRGINQIVEAVRPTLGPRPRMVAIERYPNSKTPELLDNGGVIARRIIELADRDEDVGAMLVRSLLWRLHEEVGDGTATAAVIFQSIYNQGWRYIVSGGNAVQLRRHLEKGMRVILDTLTGMTIHLEGKESLAQVAKAVCYDPPLAEMLGEIFDIIGEYGCLDIRSGRGRGLEREYIEGSYWAGGLLWRQMISDAPNLRTEMENAAILISDLEIEDPKQLVPLIETVVQAGNRSLLIVARKFSENAMALLLANRDSERFQVVPVKTPGLRSDEHLAALEDLTALTGGRPLLMAAGDTPSGVKFQDLGRARRVWADRYNFGVVGGKGDARRLREHIAGLRRSFGLAEDLDTGARLQQRIGKLMGGAAVLWVGGAAEAEITARRELAQRTSHALRGVVIEGVVPGGGVSLLACRPALEKMLDQSACPDERAAYRMLVKGLEAPFRTITANAGYDASKILAQVQLAGVGHGLDVTSGQVVDMAQAGILDVVTVQKSAVRSAIAGAALALTVDVLIHRKNVPGNPLPK